MTDDSVASNTAFCLDGVAVQAHADPYILGVWVVHRDDQLIGTISDAHAYLRGESAGYIVHRVDHTPPLLIRTWTDSIRFLLSTI